MAALAQMYVQGVSTRKVAAVTQELCGHEFGAWSISAITGRLEDQLAQFSQRPLEGAYSYMILDARKSTNMLERFNQEIKRRTLVVRIFSDEASCLRLIRAIAVETHEEWMKGSRYLNMDPFKEQIRPQPKMETA